MPAATLVGLYRNHTLFQKLAVPWAACALVKDCIAPVGASKDKGACIHDPGFMAIADDTALDGFANIPCHCLRQPLPRPKRVGAAGTVA